MSVVLQDDDIFRPHCICDSGNLATQAQSQMKAISGAHLNQHFIYPRNAAWGSSQYPSDLIVVGSHHDRTESTGAENTRALREHRFHISFIQVKLLAWISATQSDHLFSQ